MFDFMNMLVNYEDRKIDRWNSEDGLQMVSTASVTDGRKPYETAVQHPDYNGGSMVIVECYDTKEQAQAGHDKWLNLVLTNKLPSALVNCGNSEISQLIGSLDGNMSFERKTD